MRENQGSKTLGFQVSFTTFFSGSSHCLGQVRYGMNINPLVELYIMVYLEFNFNRGLEICCLRVVRPWCVPLCKVAVLALLGLFGCEELIVQKYLIEYIVCYRVEFYCNTLILLLSD